MRIKKYRANNLPEAMQLIRADLGPDALIIHSQKVAADNWLGRLRQPILEVTAAVDNDLRDFPQPTPATAQAIQQLQHELAAVKLALRQAAPLPQEAELPANLNDWYRLLLRQGVADSLARQIMHTMTDELNWAAFDKPDTVNQHLYWHLQRRLPLTNLSCKPDQRQVLFIIGPTGVGKTTTIAKLAAAMTHPHLRYRASEEGAIIITIDTFRLGAIGQMISFGEILGVPVEVAYTPAQLESLIAAHHPHRFILIDTPGCSQSATAAITELGDYLSTVPDKMVHLAVAAGTQYENMRQTVDAFSPLSIDGLIFTKLDETTSLGPAYTLTCETGLPLSYLTTGQNILDDIEPATAERLVEFVLGPTLPQISNSQNGLTTIKNAPLQTQGNRESYEL